jgi:glycolate oxidase FAD binding subunit
VDALRPSSTAELSDIVRSASADRRPLDIRGGGTRAGIGRPVQAAATLDMTALTGITLYEPAEMVIAARAGTPLTEIESALATKGQMLAFEPMDHRPLLGTSGEPTIGGIVAANVSGPRRIMSGACRDALIGAKFVNGRGEEIVSGGRVMKNVTGYDLLKVQAGAFGTLGVLTEVTFKVTPVAPDSASLVFEGLGFADAVRLMSDALGSPFEVSAAAYLPGEPSRTALRLEHFAESITYRYDRLVAELRAYGTPRRLAREGSETLWHAVRTVAPLAGGGDPVWRVSVAPTKASSVVATAEAVGARLSLADWGGGLLWLEGSDGGALRAALRATGGHATLSRGGDAFRLAVDPFEPQSEALMQLTKGLKATFDPAGIFNPGRMYAGV